MFQLKIKQHFYYQETLCPHTGGTAQSILGTSTAPLICQLDPLHGLHFPDSQSLPYFLPRSILPSQVIKATVIAATCSSSLQINHNYDRAAQEIKGYQVKITFKSLDREYVNPPDHHDIILISSDEDERATNATIKKKPIRRSVKNMDQDNQNKIPHHLINSHPQTSASLKYLYELHCVVELLNESDSNRNTSSHSNPSSPYKVKSEDNPLGSSAEPSASINMIHYFQNYTQLFSRLKLDEPLIALPLHQIHHPLAHHEDQKPDQILSEQSAAIHRHDPTADRSAPSVQNSTKEKEARNHDTMDFEIHDVDEMNNVKRDATVEATVDRTTPTDEPSPLMKENTHDTRGKSTAGEDRDHELMDEDTNDRTQQSRVHSSQAGWVNLGPCSSSCSPASGHAPSASPRRISSIAQDSYDESGHPSESGHSELSLDMLTLDLPLKDLSAKPDPINHVNAPLDRLPTVPPPMESNQWLDACGMLGLEQIELERELNEGKARHDFLHNSDPFHGHFSSRQDYCPMDPLGADHDDARLVPNQDQADGAPFAGALQIKEPPTTSRRLTPPSSPPADTNRYPTPLQSDAGPLDQMSLTNDHLPVPPLRKPLSIHPSDLHTPAHIPCLLADIPIPAQVPTGIPVLPSTSAHDPLRDDIPVPVCISTDIPVPGSIAAYNPLLADLPIPPRNSTSIPVPASTLAHDSLQADISVPPQNSTDIPSPVSIPDDSPDPPSLSDERPDVPKPTTQDTERRRRRRDESPQASTGWPILIDAESDPEDQTYVPGAWNGAFDSADNSGETQSSSWEDEEEESPGGEEDNVGGSSRHDNRREEEEPLSYHELVKRIAELKAWPVEYRRECRGQIREWKEETKRHTEVAKEKAKACRRLKRQVEKRDDILLELSQDWPAEFHSLQLRFHHILHLGLRQQIHTRYHALQLKHSNIKRLLWERHLQALIRTDLHDHLHTLQAHLTHLQSQQHPSSS
ncbi:hypothetical protein VP01_1152g4 [Puccinia sorghi]|uniref:Uncharacterized protein n=1 Tax=Puccinia sorghi TaxID=27349 RepID=A0A0L6VRY6_9BASI|nr:hypothetical protein VP01_1152g4 [Puccinia sorghi]